MKKLVLAATAALFLALPLWGEGKAEQMVNLKIDGMTCDACAQKVKKQLSSICNEVHVDWEKGEGMCHYQGPVTTSQILTEANKTGFKVTLKK